MTRDRTIVKVESTSFLPRALCGTQHSRAEGAWMKVVRWTLRSDQRSWP